jgi:hypothetical protein
VCRWLIFSPSLALALSLLFSFPLAHSPSHSLPLSGGPSLSVSQDGCGCQTTQSRTFSSLYYTTKILTSSSLKNPYFQLVVLKPITNFSRLLSPISFIRRIGDKHPDPFISLSLSLSCFIFSLDFFALGFDFFAMVNFGYVWSIDPLQKNGLCQKIGLLSEKKVKDSVCVAALLQLHCRLVL